MISGSQYVDITAVAGADLSSSQYRFVRSTGVDSSYSGGNLTAILCVNATGGVTRVKGILQNDPTSGQAATVRIDGLSKLVTAEAVAVGDFVGSSTAGAGVVVGTTGEWAAAVAESASTASGQIIAVRMLNPGLYFSAGGTA